MDGVIIPHADPEFTGGSGSNPQTMATDDEQNVRIRWKVRTFGPIIDLGSDAHALLHSKHDDDGRCVSRDP